ncbi:hypothetical protein BN1058_01863 [Paraliobacillus sp. PM-2]|uniref:hypothetical protein n=1 Tax=Paraliobacillus sp. PM-2 TaxID=1462524 RepID=UPI00061CA3E7|nr:hypothetical protein [Paraliobacillus sp. PM-2]CQR47539.1 hypothetical protein BN1058_01863 [Paraliobacillus sp. PM-2]
MIDITLLNVGSLVLGLLALTLPVINIVQGKKREVKKRYRLSVISLSACAISICFQMFYTYYLVRMEDLASLMDTIGAVALASSVLVVATILLNTIHLTLFHQKTTR